MKERTLIVAISPEGAIGLGGQIPWRHPGDLRRFKRLTTGGTVIMGRATFESIGKPLPNRRNIVLTRASIPGVECFPDLPSALATTTGPVWFIGGARVYAEALEYADRLDITYVPDRVPSPEAVRFPEIDPEIWEAGPLLPHEDEPGLSRREYRRRGS